MPDLATYIPALSIGSKVNDITGKAEDGLTAGGFAAFILSITGTAPQIVVLPDRRARLVLSSAQAVKLQSWMDKQLSDAVKLPSKPATLELALAPAIIPWALKYAIPATALVFLIGWISHWYFSK
jgi:hypothetical protein